MAILKAHHIAIRTRKFEESKAFYTDTLGFKIVGQIEGRNIVFIRIGNGGTTIELMGTDPVEAPAPVVGFTHLAFECDDVDATYAVLKAKGVQFRAEPGGMGNMRTAFFKDPDGNQLELFQSPAYHWD